MRVKGKGLTVLGSTGSIGTQTLDIVRTFPEELRVVGLAARRSLELLEAQVNEFTPKFVSCEGTPEEKADILSHGAKECTMEEMASDPNVDLVVTATSGYAALVPTYVAIEAGKNIALANKETLVMAGELISSLARKKGVSILPLDSEPNAIWQCIRGEPMEVSKLIITASGGAFRNVPISELGHVTPEQSLKHPTWQMGSKITVDSATLMNKAFEVIEAHWLFGVPWDKIEIVIHPQSLIHSMVEFIDGSVKAQISPPDMHLPIQYALFYPDRVYNENIHRFNPLEPGSLTFEAWDETRYPCFNMALDIAKREGTWPAALCGADDMAVQMFLGNQIGFMDIGPLIQDALKGHKNVADPLLEDTIVAARWAMQEVRSLVEG